VADSADRREEAIIIDVDLPVALAVAVEGTIADGDEEEGKPQLDAQINIFKWHVRTSVCYLVKFHGL